MRKIFPSQDLKSPTPGMSSLEVKPQDPIWKDKPFVRVSLCREEIIGLLLVKELILVDKNAGVRAGDIRLRALPYLQVQ